MPEPPRILTRRVFESERSEGDEIRVLVDRLWPRGMRKDALKVDRWAKDLAPSTELRRWFDHDPAKWREFESRYRFELAEKTAELKELAELARQGTLVLLFSARDEMHNQAVVLKDVLEEGIGHS